MVKGKGGIYSYIGKLNSNNQFDGQGTLHLPSGAKFEGEFQDGKATANKEKVITVPQDALEIDVTLLETAEQVIQVIGQLDYTGKTAIALKHHQISFIYQQAENLIDILCKKGINTFYNLSCFDKDTATNLDAANKKQDESQDKRIQKIESASAGHGLMRIGKNEYLQQASYEQLPSYEQMHKKFLSLGDDIKICFEYFVKNNKQLRTCVTNLVKQQAISSVKGRNFIAALHAAKIVEDRTVDKILLQTADELKLQDQNLVDWQGYFASGNQQELDQYYKQRKPQQSSYEQLPDYEQMHKKFSAIRHKDIWHEDIKRYFETFVTGTATLQACRIQLKKQVISDVKDADFIEALHNANIVKDTIINQIHAKTADKLNLQDQNLEDWKGYFASGNQQQLEQYYNLHKLRQESYEQLKQLPAYKQMDRKISLLDKNMQTFFKTFVKNNKTFQTCVANLVKQGCVVKAADFIEALHNANIVKDRKMNQINQKTADNLRLQDQNLLDWKGYFASGDQQQLEQYYKQHKLPNSQKQATPKKVTGYTYTDKQEFLKNVGNTEKSKNIKLHQTIISKAQFDLLDAIPKNIQDLETNEYRVTHYLLSHKYYYTSKNVLSLGSCGNLKFKHLLSYLSGQKINCGNADKNISFKISTYSPLEVTDSSGQSLFMITVSQRTGSLLISFKQADGNYMAPQYLQEDLNSTITNKQLSNILDSTCADLNNNNDRNALVSKPKVFETLMIMLIAESKRHAENKITGNAKVMRAAAKLFTKLGFTKENINNFLPKGKGGEQRAKGNASLFQTDDFNNAMLDELSDDSENEGNNSELGSKRSRSQVDGSDNDDEQHSNRRQKTD